jgi:hypothetical protein
MASDKSLIRKINRYKEKVRTLSKFGVFDLQNGTWNEIIIADYEAKINMLVKKIHDRQR